MKEPMIDPPSIEMRPIIADAVPATDPIGMRAAELRFGRSSAWTRSSGASITMNTPKGGTPPVARAMTAKAIATTAKPPNAMRSIVRNVNLLRSLVLMNTPTARRAANPENTRVNHCPMPKMSLISSSEDAR